MVYALLLIRLLIYIFDYTPHVCADTIARMRFIYVCEISDFLRCL